MLLLKNISYYKYIEGFFFLDFFLTWLIINNSYKIINKLYTKEFTKKKKLSVL